MVQIKGELNMKYDIIAKSELGTISLKNFWAACKLNFVRAFKKTSDDPITLQMYKDIRPAINHTFTKYNLKEGRDYEYRRVEK
jgi:hypothetical protein